MATARRTTIEDLVVRSITTLDGMNSTDDAQFKTDAQVSKLSSHYAKAMVDNSIAEAASDDIISPSEKKMLKYTWGAIEEEFPLVKAQATARGLPVNNIFYIGYVEAFDDLLVLFETGVDAVFADMTTSSVVDGVAVRILWRKYSEARQALMVDIEEQVQMFETRYIRSNSAPATPTGTDPAGWTVAVPSTNPELPVWMSGAQKASDGTLVGDWYAPVRYTGAAVVAAVLTNESQSVPTDINGDNGVYADCESRLVVYEGSQNVTAQFTLGKTPSMGTTIDSAYFDSTGIVRVTNLQYDSGYVDLQGDRSGLIVTRRFTVSKSRQGDPTPSYSMSVSSLIVLVKPDLSMNPDTLIFSSTYQTGLAAPQPYDGIWKFYINNALQFETTTPQSAYEWDGFGDILIDNVPANEILIDNILANEIILPYEYDGQEPLISMKVELWNATGLTLLDSQLVVFMADVANYIPTILGETPNYTPKHLGRFYASLPAEARKGDSWVVYDEDDHPHKRGVYIHNGTVAVWIDTELVGNEKYLAAALPDILWIAKAGLYGGVSVYGAVTYIVNLVTNAIATNQITIGKQMVDGLESDLGVAELNAKNALAYRLGFTNWAAMELEARASSTIIVGGHINTQLIEADTALIDNIFSKQITLKPGGFIQGNYVKDVSGFMIDQDGSAEFNGVKVRGSFDGIVNASQLNLASGQEMIIQPKTITAGTGLTLSANMSIGTSHFSTGWMTLKTLSKSPYKGSVRLEFLSRWFAQDYVYDSNNQLVYTLAPNATLQVLRNGDLVKEWSVRASTYNYPGSTYSNPKTLSLTSVPEIAINLNDVLTIRAYVPVNHTVYQKRYDSGYNGQIIGHDGSQFVVSSAYIKCLESVGGWRIGTQPLTYGWWQNYSSDWI
jgi:hypothetical protein